jgi:hypothetical protein
VSANGRDAFSPGHHVQLNVVRADTLRRAQAEPEAHRDLIVRVAGASARSRVRASLAPTDGTVPELRFSAAPPRRGILRRRAGTGGMCSGKRGFIQVMG